MLNFSCSISDESTDENKSLVKGKVVELEILYSQLSENHIEMMESDEDDEYEIDKTIYDSEQLKEFLDTLNKDDMKYGILIWLSEVEKKDTCYPIVEKFCIDNDVDLFSQLNCSEEVPPEEDLASWIIQSSKTTYQAD